MVEDFNEFSAVVPNPVERLHLKQFVKNYNTSAVLPGHTSVVRTNNTDTEDDLVNTHACSYSRQRVSPLICKTYCFASFYTLSLEY